MSRDEKINRTKNLHKKFCSKSSTYLSLAFKRSNDNCLIDFEKYQLYHRLANRTYRLAMDLINTPKK